MNIFQRVTKQTSYFVRLIAFLTAISFLQLTMFAVPYPSICKGQVPPRTTTTAATTPANQYMTTVHAGETVPFTGTLFSIAAAASLLADLQLSQAQCDIQITTKVHLTEANMQLQIDTEHARFTALEFRTTELSRIRDNQIEFLTKQYKPKQWYEEGVFWLGVGSIIGIIVTISAGYALGLANR